MQHAAGQSERRDAWRIEGDRLSLVRPAIEQVPLRFDAAPEALEVDLARSALIVIDMQNDFLEPEGWFAKVRGADVAPLREPVATINRLAADFRARGVPVLHVNWGIRSDAANLPANVLDKGSACGARPGYGAAIETGRVLVAGD